MLFVKTGSCDPKVRRRGLAAAWKEPKRTPTPIMILKTMILLSCGPFKVHSGEICRTGPFFFIACDAWKNASEWMLKKMKSDSKTYLFFSQIGSDSDSLGRSTLEGVRSMNCRPFYHKKGDV